jgi:hypothetical protein
VLVFVFEITTNLYSVNNYSEQNYYPVKAVVFLKKQNLVNGNVFTLYNYGGYLIWKLPGKKVFIDGRMPSWRREDVFPNESNYAFKDYLKMLEDENYFKKMAKKFNIKFVLLSTLPPKRQESAFVKGVQKIANMFVLFKTNTKVIDDDLSKIGFKKIYNDGHFTIYKI